MKNIPLIRYIYVLLPVLVLLTLTSFTNKSNGVSAYRIKTIVIDAGHGGHDGATKGLFSREKDIALQVALKLGKAIETNLKDVKVVYTRT
ncbi:MAG TPA: N-acetylmuramoyl-L-alanine amidase, partial [Daejeonella sp.]